MLTLTFDLAWAITACGGRTQGVKKVTTTCFRDYKKGRVLKRILNALEPLQPKYRMLSSSWLALDGNDNQLAKSAFNGECCKKGFGNDARVVHAVECAASHFS